MRKVEINVYKFDELSEGVKEILKRRAAEELVDERFEVFSDWSEQYLREEYGIEGKTAYSLSYCQGDGLHFETSDFLTEKIISLVLKKLQTPEERALFSHIRTYAELKVSTRSSIANRYEYALKSDVRISYDDSAVDTSKPGVVKTIVLIEETLRDLYMNICKDLEDTGYKQYDVSEEEILERLNEEEYYSDGRVYIGD